MSKNKNKPELKNWIGLPSHPTDSHLWFKTTEKEAKEIRKLYDDVLMEGNPFAQRDLDDLLSRVTQIAKEETEFFSEGD